MTLDDLINDIADRIAVADIEALLLQQRFSPHARTVDVPRRLPLAASWALCLRGQLLHRPETTDDRQHPPTA